MTVSVSFIAHVSEQEFGQLNEGYEIISKMILIPDDEQLFRYQRGDHIQVETRHGNRLWCRIEQLEKVVGDEQVLLILTLAARREQRSDTKLVP